MNTVRLPRFEPELVDDAVVGAAEDLIVLPAQAAANNMQFAAMPASDCSCTASSPRERRGAAAAALVACAASLGSVVALFASVS